MKRNAFEAAAEFHVEYDAMTAESRPPAAALR